MPTHRNVLGGIGLLVLSGLATIWLVGNDITGFGATDDSALAMIPGTFAYGLRLIFG